MVSQTIIAALFTAASYDLGLPPKLLESLCWVESHHKPHAVNKADGNSDSIGICQVKQDTARMVLNTRKDVDLLDPSVNIRVAGKYLRNQIDRYDGDIRCGVAAYNAGICRLNARGQIRNRKYVKKVLTEWTERGAEMQEPVVDLKEPKAAEAEQTVVQPKKKPVDRSALPFNGLTRKQRRAMSSRARKSDRNQRGQLRKNVRRAFSLNAPAG